MGSKVGYTPGKVASAMLSTPKMPDGLGPPASYLSQYTIEIILEMGLAQILNHTIYFK